MGTRRETEKLDAGTAQPRDNHSATEFDRIQNA